MTTLPLTYDPAGAPAADSLPVGLPVVVTAVGCSWGGAPTEGCTGRIEGVYPGWAIARRGDVLRVRLDDGRLVPLWTTEVDAAVREASC